MNILLLSSSNRNFPLDVQETIQSGGQSAIRFSSLADFFASPLRKRPYLAILEIGCPEDINRSILAFEWSLAEETPCKFLLLLASRYLQLNEKALRFGGAEITTLPLPKKNLLFKIELQLKLLLSEKPKTPSKAAFAFQAEFEMPVLEKQRVLKIKGPSPQEGNWNKEEKLSPSGKIRWRWIRSQAVSAKEPDHILPTWTLTSDIAPVYLQEEKAWLVEDGQAEITGTFEEEVVYSSVKAKEEWLKSSEENAQSPAKAEAGQDMEKILRKETGKPEEEEKKNLKNSPGKNISESESAVRTEQKRESREQIRREHQSTESKTAAPILKKPAGVAPVSEIKATEKGGSENPEQKREREKSPGTAANDPVKPKWESHINTKNEKPHTPGEDLRDRELDNRQKVALQGVTEELQKREKVHKEQLESKVKDHCKTDILKDEEMIPKNPDLATEESRIKEKALSFDMTEKKSRAVLGEEESIESRRKTLDLFWESEESPQKSRTAAEELPLKEPGSQEEESLERKRSAKPQVQPDDSMEENLSSEMKEANTEEASADSYQSVAKSYFKDKEVSKEIQIEGKPFEKTGKIEVEIRGSPPMLELERTIAPFPEKLESKVTFSADPLEKIRDSDFLKTRHFEVLTLTQLNDQNSTWHPVDQFRVYLSAKHRYYGIKDLNEVFPLWIYTGELAPEFIEQEKAWKFYDRSPQRFLSGDPLPVPVARFLQQMAGITSEQMESFRLGIKPSEPMPAHKELETSRASVADTAQLNAKSSLRTEEKKKPKQGGMLGFIKKVLGLENPET